MLLHKRCPDPDIGALRGPSFKAMCAILSAFCLPFSTRPNAKYGLKDMLIIFSYMWHVQRCSIERATRELESMGHAVPKADWVLRLLQQKSVYDVESWMGRMLVMGMRKMGDVCYAAIDHTIIARYDKCPDTHFLLKGRRKGGTKIGARYLASRILGPLPLTSSMLRVTGDKTTPVSVKRLLKGIKKSLGASVVVMLADREFANVKTMLAVEGLGLKFIMPVASTPGIKVAEDEYRRGDRDAVSRYTMKSRKKRDVITFTLLIIEQEGKLFKFATNLGMSREEIIDIIPKKYGGRWDIETNFRTVKKLMPITTTSSEAVRMFMLYMTFLLCNQWVTVCQDELGRRVQSYMYVLALMTAGYEWLREHRREAPD